MTIWDTYPPDYRSKTVQAIQAAVRSGDCVSLLGLSGAGKSNLLGFLAHRASFPGQGKFLLVDCNRLPDGEVNSLFRLIRSDLDDNSPAPAEHSALERTIGDFLSSPDSRLCLLLDRFDRLDLSPGGPLPGNLRALRDAFKYALTLVAATRHPLDPQTELSELFFGHTIWLGPLDENDARWSISTYAARRGLSWNEDIVKKILQVTWGYPALLRSVAEALAAGSSLDIDVLLKQPAVQHRITEFWSDHPTAEEIHCSGLEGQPLLEQGRQSLVNRLDPSRFTAKEYLLLVYFQNHPGVVCEKDDLIRAVWPEDRVFDQGVRDDSLAQLVRRLREKIEPDASHPVQVLSIPGRGYKFTP